MNITIYEGYDLEDLIGEAKGEFGENVKILKCEVQNERGWIPFFKKKKFSLYVEVPSKETKKFDDVLLSEAASASRGELDMEGLLSKIETMMDEKIKSLGSATLSQRFPLPAHTEAAPYARELFEEFTGEALDLLNLLVKKEVEPEIAKLLVREGCGLDIDSNKMDLNTHMFRDAIIKGVKKHVRFTGPLQIKKGGMKVIAFIGPTGVGKTTNLFKIASELVINQNLRVAVISIDTFKVGAIGQARAYANILGIAFYAIADSKNLRRTLSSLEQIDVVLIDTVGRSQYDYWRLGEMKEVLGGGSDMEIILTISCNYKNSEAIEIVNRFRAFFPVSSLFFTKIDETYRPGILVNLPVKTRLPVSFISTGQRVPEDIRIMNPERVADYLLGE